MDMLYRLICVVKTPHSVLLHEAMLALRVEWILKREDGVMGAFKSLVTPNEAGTVWLSHSINDIL